MISYRVALVPLFFALVGCASTELQVEKKTQTLASQVIYLPPLTEMLTSKHKRVEPVLAYGYLMSFEGSRVVFFDPEKKAVHTKLRDFSVQSEPVILEDSFILLTKEHGLVQVSWPGLEIMSEKKLDAPLLSKPIALENGDVFIQYIHNVTELLSSTFQLKWKTSLPSTSHYYQASAYQPIADRESIYLSIPGNSLVALDRKTGLTRWNYQGFVEFNSTPSSVLVQKQITFPLALSGETLVLKVSDGSIHTVDKNSGIGLEILSSAPETPILQEDKSLYYIDDKGTLLSYDLEQRKLSWSTELMEKLSVVALQSIGNGTLVINGLLPHLYVIDKENGHIREHFVHQYHHARLLSDLNNDTIYGIDKFGVLFKLQPEKFG